MKKLFACVLTAILLLLCFTACDSSKKDKGVTCNEYENCAIFTFDDFPIKDTVSFELTRIGLGEGAIYYQVNLEEGAFCIRYKDTGLFHREQQLGEFRADDEMPLLGSGGYIEGDIITIAFHADSPVSGEVIIAFTEDALKAVHGDLHLHEHTYRWDVTENTHKRIYTCGCEGEAQRDPDLHYDEDDNGFCDECNHVTKKPIIEKPTNHLLHNQKGVEWLSSLKADDVAEVKTMWEYIGVAPGSLKTIESSPSYAAIAHMLESFCEMQTVPISKEDAQVDGGSAFTVRFILKNGTEYKLYFNNLIFLDANGLYYKLPYIPTLYNHVYMPDEEVDIYQSFAFTAYDNTGEIYSYGESYPELSEKIGMIEGLDELEFCESRDIPAKYPIYMIKTEFGKLDIFDETSFATEYGCYQLLNGNFFELFGIDK